MVVWCSFSSDQERSTSFPWTHTQDARGAIALYVGMLLARLLAPMLSGVLSRFLCDAIWFKKYLAGCYSVLR